MIYVIHEEYRTKNMVILDLNSGGRANKLLLRANESIFFSSNHWFQLLKGFIYR